VQEKKLDLKIRALFRNEEEERKEDRSGRALIEASDRQKRPTADFPSVSRRSSNAGARKLKKARAGRDNSGVGWGEAKYPA
jgi:hypothetical protein